MPYGRRTYRKRRTTRKPVKRRSFRRRTSRKPTVRTLARRVTTLARQQTENIRTTWSRNPLSIQTAATSGKAYVCPIPYSGCDFQDTLFPSTDAVGWSDNLGLASQPIFRKAPMFGYSEAAMHSPMARHMGGHIKYEIISTEPSMTKVTLALIQPRKSMADQLTEDRRLKAQNSSTTAPGSGGVLDNEFDWVANTSGSTYFGATFNKKYWQVHYQREMTFGVPGGGDFSGVPGITLPIPNQNGLTASGTIKLPAGGQIKNVKFKNQPTTPERQYNPWTEPGITDERNENTCYLVAIQNGVSADLEQITMSFIVNDYYKVPI